MFAWEILRKEFPWQAVLANIIGIVTYNRTYLLILELKTINNIIISLLKKHQRLLWCFFRSDIPSSSADVREANISLEFFFKWLSTFLVTLESSLKSYDATGWETRRYIISPLQNYIFMRYWLISPTYWF